MAYCYVQFCLHFDTSHFNDKFLALLDYVSRAHEIKIRPLFVVRRLSYVVRPWHRLSLKLLHGLLSNFSCRFPWAICPDVFFIFEKIFFFDFLGFFSSA